MSYIVYTDLCLMGVLQMNKPPYTHLQPSALFLFTFHPLLDLRKRGQKQLSTAIAAALSLHIPLLIREA